MGIEANVTAHDRIHHAATPITTTSARGGYPSRLNPHRRGRFPEPQAGPHRRAMRLVAVAASATQSRTSTLGVRSRSELARTLPADSRSQPAKFRGTHDFKLSRPPSVDRVPSYLVETFLARGAAGERERARAAGALGRRGNDAGGDARRLRRIHPRPRGRDLLLHVRGVVGPRGRAGRPAGRARSRFVSSKRSRQQRRHMKVDDGSYGRCWRRSGSSAADGRRGVGGTAAGDAVRTGRRLPCRDDAGRVLEHRGPVCDRPGRPGRRLRAENFGNKFPGEAAVYMGIVHVAIYDAAVAIEGGYQPYAITPPAPAGHLARGRDRDRGARHAHRPAAAARPDPASRRSSTATMPPTWRRSRDGHGEGERDRGRPAGRRRPCSRCARTTAAEQQPDARRPRPARRRARRLATRARAPVLGPGLPGMRPLALDERLAVPARRAQRADQHGVRRGLQPGRGARPRRQHQPGRPTQTNQALLLDRPRHPAVERRHAAARRRRGASTSCRPRGCWRWRTSPAATR